MVTIKYLAVVAGGIGPDVWDREVEVEADNIREALEIVEKNLEHDEVVISIEQTE